MRGRDRQGHPYYLQQDESVHADEEKKVTHWNPGLCSESSFGMVINSHALLTRGFAMPNRISAWIFLYGSALKSTRIRFSDGKKENRKCTHPTYIRL